MKLSINSSLQKRLTQQCGLIAAPMHGQGKLSSEGYRTRDGHLIEWFGRLLDSPVGVVSRPDPAIFHLLSHRKRKQVAENTIDISTPSMRLPNFRNRRAWWFDSAKDYPAFTFEGLTPLITWNPFLLDAHSLSNPSRKVHFDILDDWTNHFAFAHMTERVDAAYASIFDSATSITANSESTLDLAHRFGREDAVLLTNGVDPERFSTSSVADGPMTVGYVGKIGKRVDLDLVVEVANALPEVKFVFAGPFLDSEYEEPLRALTNAEILGDVHYAGIPKLLERFDIGWVPHRLGDGEVGGDVIKTYEYRAAGLPVLTTPVLGAGDRGLTNVHVLPREDHLEKMRSWARAGNRVSRRPEVIPDHHTWSFKAQKILAMLQI